MANGPLEQAHHIAALLALLKQRKNRIERLKKSLHNIRRMFDTNVDAVACKVAFRQHLLRDKGLVCHRTWVLERESGQCGQTPVTNRQTVFIRQ